MIVFHPVTCEVEPASSLQAFGMLPPRVWKAIAHQDRERDPFMRHRAMSASLASKRRRADVDGLDVPDLRARRRQQRRARRLGALSLVAFLLALTVLMGVGVGCASKVKQAPKVNGFSIEPGANLSGADLSGANLSGMNLEGANLLYANLYNAKLEGTNLSNVKALGANFEKASLKRANLQNADFTEAFLGKADLTGVTATGSKFIKSNLTEADLTTGQFEDALFMNAILQQATLKQVVFYEANLSGANLTGTRVHNSNLARANLRYAVFDNVVVEETSFMGANVNGANFGLTSSLGANRMTGAYFDDATRFPENFEPLAHGLVKGNPEALDKARREKNQALLKSLQLKTKAASPSLPEPKVNKGEHQ